MNKKQAIQSFNAYISFRTQAKEELEEIKKITNFQEQRQKADISFEKHSRNFLSAQGILNSYNLSGEVNLNDFWEYSGIVNELKTIKDDFKEKSSESGKNNGYYVCEHCKQTKTGQYWYNKTEGEGRIKPVSKVKGYYSKFCSEECINLWRQKNLAGNDNVSNSKNICHHCQSSFSTQPWTAYDERKKTTHKFCSQSCCDNFCHKYNQVVVAWNTLILERKNLKVPNFPSWEELETKQVNGKLESYVEEIKRKIKGVRENQTVDSKEEEDKEKDIVSPLNPISKDKVNDDNERERERERRFWTKKGSCKTLSSN